MYLCIVCSCAAAIRRVIASIVIILISNEFVGAVIDKFAQMLMLMLLQPPATCLKCVSSIGQKDGFCACLTVLVSVL